MSNIAIIPARGGSRRIPNKNIRLFHGKPIIAYSIETALLTGLFDQVYVSTDSLDIGNISIHYGADWLYRPRELADDLVGTQELITCLLHQRNSDVIDLDYICVIYATAPLMSAVDIARGLEILQASGKQYSQAWCQGKDPGQFYWGYTEAYYNGVPLIGNCEYVEVDPACACDINTMQDWEKAEAMYRQAMGIPWE